MNGVRPAWFHPPLLEEANCLFDLAYRYRRIAVVQGPASSGKRELCQAVWRKNTKELSFDEFESADFSFTDLKAHVEDRLKILGAFSGGLFQRSPKSPRHFIALYDLPLHGRNGLVWLLGLQRRVHGVGFVLTSHRELLRVLPGGFLPPDAFLYPLVLLDWNEKNIKALFATWPAPWKDLARRIEAGEKDAIASATAIVEATAGRQGQLAAFAEYWESSFLRDKSLSRDAYHSFTLEAIHRLAALLFPLHPVGPSNEKNSGPPNQTKHDYLPALQDLTITIEN